MKNFLQTNETVLPFCFDVIEVRADNTTDASMPWSLELSLLLLIIQIILNIF